MYENILVDEVPKTVTIDGRVYPINWEFRYMILFELNMLHNPSFSVKDVLDLFYAAEIPPDREQAVRELMKFYAGDKPKNTRQKSATATGAEALYCFDYDDELIYAAFLQQYGVNLQSVENLHWFEFRAMFHALNGDCKIVEIMRYRGLDLTTVENAKMRELYNDLKELYEIPLPKSEQEKIDAINEALMNGGDLTGLL